MNWLRHLQERGVIPPDWDLDAFLASEVDRYRAQLRDYRDALRQLEPERPIRTALYFPLLQRFEEVDVDATTREADTAPSE